MPTYCFRDDNDEPVDLTCSYSELEDMGYDGETLTHEGRRLTRDIEREHGGFKHTYEAGWPLVSDAAAVHPDRISEAQSIDRDRGVSTNYTKSGQPIFTSSAHRKAYLKAHGLHDRNSYGV